MLKRIFEDLKNDNVDSVKNVFSVYEGHDMGFVVNEDPAFEFENGEYTESMQNWSLLEVAIALKAQSTVQFLLKDPKTCVMARADFSNPELKLDESPHIVDSVEDLLDLEIKPLRLAIVLNEHRTLNRLWRTPMAWESCHFLRVIELLLKHKFQKGLDTLISVNNSYEYIQPLPIKAAATTSLKKAIPNIRCFYEPEGI